MSLIFYGGFRLTLDEKFFQFDWLWMVKKYGCRM